MTDLPISILKRLPSTEEQRAFETALQEIFAALNRVPEHLIFGVMKSAVITFCLNQDDPDATFEALGDRAADAIERQLAVLNNPAGTA